MTVLKSAKTSIAAIPSSVVPAKAGTHAELEQRAAN
jgi:hypothetical protein